jgi:hypothetical protein
VRSRAAGALLAFALAVGGCGGGGDDTPKAKTPKDAFLGYYDALAKRDVGKACSYTTGPAASTCERDAQALLKTSNDPKLLAENTHTILDSQTFVVRGDLACVGLQRFSFDAKKTGDGWKVLRFRRPLTDPRDCTVGLKS